MSIGLLLLAFEAWPAYGGRIGVLGSIFVRIRRRIRNHHFICELRKLLNGSHMKVPKALVPALN
jgi:hypothetical protein